MFGLAASLVATITMAIDRRPFSGSITSDGRTFTSAIASPYKPIQQTELRRLVTPTIAVFLSSLPPPALCPVPSVAHQAVRSSPALTNVTLLPPPSFSVVFVVRWPSVTAAAAAAEVESFQWRLCSWPCPRATAPGRPHSAVYRFRVSNAARLPPGRCCCCRCFTSNPHPAVHRGS